ncbi:hypothetical protein [Nocardiopsis suaedae]|uniref:GATA-type domain-containing protein n=1 Tax=Nocardiopsis suaedae TaxID=3018444 RepID=A0ABT4TK12_9ACTN|nr:hypothetical protein [Nocardiopsis suaedae]MDA2804462.1 hypothetical protein [Nocardiopsis suaedae]
MAITSATYYQITCGLCGHPYEADGGPLLFATRSDAAAAVAADPEWGRTGPGGGQEVCRSCLDGLECERTAHPWRATSRPGLVLCDRCHRFERRENVTGPVLPELPAPPAPGPAPVRWRVRSGAGAPPPF